MGFFDGGMISERICGNRVSDLVVSDLCAGL